MKRIPLTQGKFAIVDDEDYEELNRWKWHIHRKGNGDLRGACRVDNKTKKIILMHRAIMKAPLSKQVDHVDHNVLHNHKANLRLCTNSQNSQNRQPYLGKTSQYKGVSQCKQTKKLKAGIMLNGKNIHLGYYENEIGAAKAYDQKAKELFGEYAYVNF